MSGRPERTGPGRRSSARRISRAGPGHAGSARCSGPPRDRTWTSGTRLGSVGHWPSFVTFALRAACSASRQPCSQAVWSLGRYWSGARWGSPFPWAMYPAIHGSGLATPNVSAAPRLIWWTPSTVGNSSGIFRGYRLSIPEACSGMSRCISGRKGVRADNAWTGFVCVSRSAPCPACCRHGYPGKDDPGSHRPGHCIYAAPICHPVSARECPPRQCARH